MKPDWDKLMAKYEDSDTVLIADCDCTAAGKDLCSTVGVQGYPTIKYGTPGSLEKYEGGRTYSDLEKFASTLKPSCSPSNIDLCDEDGKAEIEALQALDPKELAKDIAAGEAEMAAAESDFSAAVEKLQAQYKKLTEDKDATLAKIKDSGLSLKKSVAAAKKNAAKAAKKAARKAKRAAAKAKAAAEKAEL